MTNTKLEAAAQQALENAQPSVMAPEWTFVRSEDIDALSEALAEQATEPDWKSEATALRVNEQNLEARLAAEPVTTVRSDAVNLARNMLEVRDCKGITSHGVRVLCEAVMQMHEHSAQQAAELVDGALDRTLNERDDAEDFIDALLAEQATEQRPQNCGTGFCSCIECPYGTQQAAERVLKAWDDPQRMPALCEEMNCLREALAAVPEAHKQPAQQQQEPVDSEHIAALRTLSYCDGVQAGWNFCADGDEAAMARALSATSEAMRLLKTHPDTGAEVWVHRGKQ